MDFPNFIDLSEFHLKSEEKTMDNIPWSEIDKEMHPIVKLLNDNGIETFACCSGHGEENPWVNCQISDNYNEKDIIMTLINNGYCGFSLKNVRFVNRLKDPIRNGDKWHFWSIEFWNLPSSVTKANKK